MIVNIPEPMIEQRVKKLKLDLDNISDPLVEKDKLYRVFVKVVDITIESDTDRTEPRNAIYGAFLYGKNSYVEAMIDCYDGHHKSDLILDYAILSTWLTDNREKFQAMETLIKE